MKLRDLGELGGPVLIYGGPYSNLHATRAVFERARALGIGPERRICTGDVIAYCADAAGTLAAVRAEGGAVVAGNCERQIAAGAEDCGCGFDAGSACDLLSRGWYPHALGAVNEAARAWLAALPDLLLFRQGGRRFAVIHGGLTDISRFLWPSSQDRSFEEEFAAVAAAAAGPVDTIIAGHCGLAFQRDFGRFSWINAGVIGMPPHDGRAATRYVLLDGDRALIARLDYDAAAARRAMERAGLTQGYERALTGGHWPSEDVLPPELRRGPRHGPRHAAPAQSFASGW